MKTILISILFFFAVFSISQAQWRQCNGPIGGKISHLETKGTSVFAGTPREGIYRSTDMGNSWVAVNNGLANKSVRMITVCGAYVLTSTEKGIYRSSDDGNEWKLLPQQDTTLRNISIISCNNILYLYDWNKGTYRSADYGETWTKIASLQTINTIISIGNTQFAGTNGGVFESIDNGITWKVNKTFSNDTEGDVEINSFAFAGNTLFASSNDVIHRTTDSGRTWSSVADPNWMQYADIYLAAIGNIVYAGTRRYNRGSVDYRTSGVYTSISGNKYEWGRLNISSDEPNVNAIVSVGTTLLIGTQLGFHRSADSGRTWTISNTGFATQPIRKVTPLGTKLYTTLGYDDGLKRVNVHSSSDKGETWIPISLPLGLDIRSLTENEGTIYVATYGDGIYRSSDAGVTWVGGYLKSPAKSVDNLVVNGTTVFISSSNVLFRSTDNGERWDKLVFNSANGYITNIYKFDNALHICTSVGLFQSFDNGDTWTQENDYICYSNHVVVPTAQGTAIFKTLSNGVFLSTDNGVSWREPNYDFRYLDVTSLVAIGKVLFVGTPSNGVFYSSDYGDTWTKINTGLGTLDISTLEVVGTTLFAGTYGLSVWKVEWSELLNVQSEQKLPNISQLLSYPNPATNTLTIDRTNLQFPENTPVHYTLSTLIGGKVMEFDNSAAKFTVSLEGMTNGVYSLTAVSGGNRAAVMVTVAE